MNAPLVITVAPNGARRTKADHPALPLTPEEIAAAAAASREAGAAVLHLHVRDKSLHHTLDPEIYRAATAAVRRAAGKAMIVQITTEAVGIFTPDEQMAAVRAVQPEAVSLAIRELIPDAKAEAAAAEFFIWLRQNRVLPQFILYDPPDVARFHDLRRRGLIPWDRPWVLFVLGRYASDMTGRPAELVAYIAAHDLDCPWSVCAFGPLESACVVAAASLGGHGRVGFENNLRLADGSIAPDNAALVAQYAQAAALIGRPVADADAAREALGACP
ncbi:MAG: 3-keto-5-aminohexanoate cleavage protein [Pseudomonadota bacterium]|nr:3-keto-5-aminohexanoate cleavage protein [Pseudomonadota bacterium]